MTFRCPLRVTLQPQELKGHWTSITSSPNFFHKKSWDIYTIRSVCMGKDCMLSFTFQIGLLLKKCVIIHIDIDFFSVPYRVTSQPQELKGHWTSITSSPNFFHKKKSWDIYTIRSVCMGKDCMLSFTVQIGLLLKKCEIYTVCIFLAFSIFQSRLQ